MTGAAPHKGKPPELKEEHLRTEQGSERPLSADEVERMLRDRIEELEGALRPFAHDPSGLFSIHTETCPHCHAHRILALARLTASEASPREEQP